jgi:hypothetical protein
MAAPFRLKVGDTLPALIGQCLDAKNTPIPTLGAMVTFRMRPQVTGLRAPIVAAGSWDDPATAMAKYEWQAGDTDVPGLYDCDFLVDFGGGVTESFPNGEYVVVEILPAA